MMVKTITNSKNTSNCRTEGSGPDDQGGTHIMERDNSNLLSYDELFSIRKRLGAHDRLSFRAVCKSWLAVHKEWTRRQPWTVTFLNSPEVQKLAIRDPCSNSLPYTKFVRDEAMILDGAQIVACKGKWFLLVNNKQELFCLAPAMSSSNVIKLPSCASWASSCTIRACLSDEPTSPGCVILVMKSDPYWRACVDIMTYRPGDEAWEARVLGVEFGENTVEECKNVVYGDGKFYFVFGDGNMGQLILADNVWSFLLVQLPKIVIPRRELSMHLVRHEEELWLVNANNCEMPFHVFRLDWENMVWVRKQELGGGVIFLTQGCNSLFFRGTGVGDSFANKIVFCPRDYTWCYCLDTRKHEIIESYLAMA